MRMLTIQNDFTHGAFSDRLIARSDITLYNKAARKLENVLVIPEGGAQRRFGTQFIADIASHATTLPNVDEYKLEQFQFSETDASLFLFIDSELLIFRNDSFYQKIASPFLGSEVGQLSVSQSTNLLVIAHPNHAPRQISFDVTTSLFTFSTIGFTFVPVHDFFQGDYDAQTFTLAKIGLGATTLTVTAGTFTFTDEFVGGAFIAAGGTVTDPIGYARITSRVSPTVVNVNIISLFGVKANSGTDCKPLAKAWSDLEADSSGNRGWPVSTTFYQGRLYFGGSRSLPQTLFGSKVADFIDFETITGEDDDAINAEIASNQINDIKHLIADRSLQIFTFASEWAPSQDAGAPITPSTLSIRKQSNFGSTQVSPVLLDNVTFYVKRGGKGVMSFGFEIETESYTSSDVSILSSDLIRNPVDSAVLSGSTREDADYLFLCNDDGTMAAFQTSADQEVAAWSLQTTQDTLSDSSIKASFKRVQEVGQDDIFFLTERTINGARKVYLEKANFDFYTDCTIFQVFTAPVNLVNGLTALEGMTVQVIVDGFVVEPQTVVSGAINLPNGLAGIDIRVGFQMLPKIETLPIVQVTQMGPNNFIPKRVNRFFINFHDSLGVIVDGQQIANLKFGKKFDSDGNLDGSNKPRSGVEQIYKEDWEISPTVTITQVDPVPMTVLALGYEVSS